MKTETKKEPMIKLRTAHGYDYYMGRDEKCNYFYCLVPEGSEAPVGGYYNSNYACSIKNVPNLF